MSPPLIPTNKESAVALTTACMRKERSSAVETVGWGQTVVAVVPEVPPACQPMDVVLVIMSMDFLV